MWLFVTYFPALILACRFAIHQSSRRNFPGQAMTLEAEPPAELLAHVAQQIQVALGKSRLDGKEEEIRVLQTLH